ncbi:serine beta-lactamase-like protein LACTB, mitochondrial [Protobothrops mucrosquamatus]|uniref:serine beta-lactamase-like protein LACTB, mitochondrial n=1 Tax=Protobothrops mucrosquamatus TaxID=103944 RepID=UPI0007758094|nr:serine beta-lactamase-like protein LACTB, mitochondrial [Protobothrops mucrosquamatus]
MRLLLRGAAARWAALRLFGGVFRSARGPLWRLGLGLGLAATAVAVAGPDGGSEERPPGEPGFQRAVARSRDLLQRLKDEVGAPGVVVGVSVDGREVWAEGIGYADLENRVLCGPETVLRIASISKSLTMVAVAKLWEEGKLDLDAAVQKYVPEFPEKEYEGEKVTISTRLLVSHLSGIRHYEKDISKVKEEKEKANRKAARTAASAAKEKENKETEKRDLIKGKPEQEGKNSKSGRKKREFEHEEYYLKDKFEHVIDSLNIFQNDPLFFKPGSQFLYSTHGFTLLSAVVEGASNQKFTDYMLKIFSDLGMGSTGLDENEPLIYNRARYYIHNKKGHLINAPYVDNSYKWAGGGFVSTVGDLLRFGNAMLYGYQLGQVKNLAAGFLPGYLKPDTIAMMWTTVPQSQDYAYGMAWFIVEKKQECGHCKEQQHYTFHTGGAVGASSVLLILPEELNSGIANSSCLVPPHGVVVTVICNMQSVHLDGIALKIAKEFEKDRLVQCSDQRLERKCGRLE